MQALVKHLLQKGVIPAPKHLGRSSHTLPSTIMNQIAFGVGLRLQEFGSPKWTNKSLIITQVEAELGSISGNFYGTVLTETPHPNGTTTRSFSPVKRIDEVDSFGGKWAIAGRVFDPLSTGESQAFLSKLPKPSQ